MTDPLSGNSIICQEKAGDGWDALNCEEKKQEELRQLRISSNGSTQEFEELSIEMKYDCMVDNLARRKPGQRN